MDAELNKKFDRLFDQGKHSEIAALIEQIPESEWDWDLADWYVLALNNTWEFEQAVEVSLRYREPGKDEPQWYYRLGYAYVNLSRYDEAEAVLLRGKELAQGDSQVTEWIDELLAQVAEDREDEAEKAAVTARRRAAYTPREPGRPPFDGFDFTDFWDNDEYALKEYIGEPVTDEMIAEAEKALGYKLPESYIWLMKQQNGGTPVKTLFAVDTGGSELCCADITCIMGLDKNKTYSLTGELGSQFMIEEWGYPEIGVAICDCPSAGHDMIFLDYRARGKDGEPEVVHIDQEAGYEITYLAGDFESFVRGLSGDDDE